MALEVYSQTKPAYARRTLLSALILFGGTGLLGARMTSERGRALLDDRVELKPLHCSIRPPRGAVMTNQGALRAWLVQTFDVLVSRTAWGSFAVWHTSLDEPNAGDRLAAEVFAELHPTSALGGLLSAGVRSRDVAVGTFQGVELQNAENGVVVRVAGIPGKGYFALSMISDAPFEAWQAMFDRSCRSLEITP